MNDFATYDFVIAGGGAAGLSLAYWLINSPLAEQKILLIDKSHKYENDKTWCFWSRQDLPFSSTKKVWWDELTVSYPKGRYRSDVHPYRYYHTRSQDFYGEILSLLESHPSVTIRYEEIVDWGSNKDCAWVRSKQETYRATWMFNSLPPVDIGRDPQKIWLAQHFLGMKIRTNEACFDPKNAELMDFRVPQIQGPCFMYLLPLTSREALVEFTSFSTEKFPPNLYREEIADYMERKYGVTTWEVLEEEKGLIPMTSQPFERKAGSRILNIGTRGGMTKASTGYTFLPIQRDSQHIVKSLLATGHPFDLPKQKKRHRFYDNILLRVMQDEPHRIPEIMAALFRKGTHVKVLRFLDETSTFWEEMTLLLQLPWPPFLRALWKSIRYAPLFSQTQLSSGRHQLSDPPTHDVAPSMAPSGGMGSVHSADGGQRYSSRSY